MNSSFFNTLFSTFIGEYIPFSNSFTITDSIPVEDSVPTILSYSEFQLSNAIGCLDIPFICSVITFGIMIYFLFAAFRVVFSR